MIQYEPVDLTVPLEQLLTSGGDSRLRIDPNTGLNGYGCSPQPRPSAITFASCTATSISAGAFAAADALRQRLVEGTVGGNFEAVVELEFERIRREISNIYCGELGAEVILAPSGTDAELYVLEVVLSWGVERLVNVVTGPRETGKNVCIAAAGRHFDSRTALGAAVSSGALLDGLTEGQIRVEVVPVRDCAGAALASTTIDLSVTAAVERAIEHGCHVVLHVLEPSKTGLLAPSHDTIADLKQRHPTHLDVLVDASQLRTSEHTIATYLRENCMVLLTGSKFMTGPPFAGALLLPHELADRVRDAAPLPGLSGYSTYCEWPKRWPRLRAGLCRRPNIGLLLRWEAALRELQTFFAVPTTQAKSCLVAVGDAIVGSIKQRPNLRPISTIPICRSQTTGEAWDNAPSIFAFAIFHNQRCLELSELSRIYRWLNQDISTKLPATASRTDLSLAATLCHVAQPIQIAEGVAREVAVMRVSIGARLVSRVAFDQSRGSTTEVRLKREFEELTRMFAKLDLILRLFDDLSSDPAQPYN